MKNKEQYNLGKLKHKYLAKLLSNLEIQDNRVIMGSKLGEDAAVIDIPGENYLVAKTDPITFATSQIGYYVVNINVNDLVCTGAQPKWFQSTILLPQENTTDELVDTIFTDIHNTCKSMGITVIGGHIEVTPNLDRPLIIGSLLGEVKKENLVLTSGAEPGDALILTKGIFIEGTCIIGREKKNELLRHNYDHNFIEKCKDYLYKPGISVYKEALLASENFQVKAMHDPTEGGIYTAIAEMTIASNTGILIEEKKINVLPEPKILSEIFDLNPYNTIASGSLLIAVNQKDSSNVIDLLRKNKIFSEQIGIFMSNDKGLKVRKLDGTINVLKYSETDEITKII
ncbi:MAG: AIR synthase family protein [Promethearchaeota archaeon]